MLNPRVPPEGIPRERYFQGRDPEQMRQSQEYLAGRAQELGLPMQTPSIIANSRRALLLAEYARRVGRFDAVHRRLFAAYWVDGRNLADDATLREVAAASGLDVEAALAAVDAEEDADVLAAAMQEATLYGISSVPTFVVDDRYAIVGAQPLEWMQQAMSQIAAEVARESEG